MRKILSRLAFIHFIIVVLFLVSCSTAPTIIEREVLVPYPVPGVHDTITLIQNDTVEVWEGDVTDSLNNVIGNLKVYYKKQIAELKLYPHIDTVHYTYTDTLKIDGTTVFESYVIKLIGLTLTVMPAYQKIIVILLLFGLLYVIYLRKK